MRTQKGQISETRSALDNPSFTERGATALPVGINVVIGTAEGDFTDGTAVQDLILLLAGGDFSYAGAGNDLVFGGEGADYIWGEDGDDFIFGSSGADVLHGGLGDDFIIGGIDGDRYSFGWLSTTETGQWGHDVIVDNGDAPSYLNEDLIDIYGLYGPSDDDLAGAMARLSFGRSADNMVVWLDGGTSTITVVEQFAGDESRVIEYLELDAAYWTAPAFEIVDGERTDLGNDRDHGSFGSEANEIMFGTDLGEEIFGGTGYNFIWTGGGADVLIYKPGDGESFWPYGGGVSSDIVEDFDIAMDLLDFSETKLGFADLTISEQADGDATVSWISPDYEVASIFIELRGVDMVDVTADLFIF